MAVTGTPSNRFKYRLFTGALNLSTDTLKCALMKTGFTFDKDAHHQWSDVSSSELAGGYGYTTLGQILTTVAITESDASDRADLTCANPTWTASGGAIGPTPGAIIYDDTDVNKSVIGHIDFGGDQTTNTGNNFVIASVIVRLT